MKIYNYHPESGEYIGTSEANLDPLETIAQKKEVYLLPANATFELPPATGECETAVCVSGKWQIVPDSRKEKYYLPTGEEITITELGVTVPKDALLEPPPPPKPTREQLYETAIKVKEKEILRRQAIAELKAEQVKL